MLKAEGESCVRRHGRARSSQDQNVTREGHRGSGNNTLRKEYVLPQRSEHDSGIDTMQSIAPYEKLQGVFQGAQHQ